MFDRILVIRQHNPNFLNSSYVFLDVRDFLHRQKHDKIIQTFCAQKVKLEKAKIWLESEYKEFYDEVAFEPTRQGNFRQGDARILNGEIIDEVGAGWAWFLHRISRFDVVIEVKSQTAPE